MALYDDHLKKKISELPSSPGVYQYFDSSGVIIYIGKAKNLKNRVLSYLNQSNQSNKTRILVNKITDLRYIVVNSEQDALLLENNLIKKYKPRYNILLKDDKSYPWICIKKEPYPRVFLTRRFVHDGSEYFGPYTSGKFAHVLISLIKSLFKLRTCKLALNTKAVYNNRFKVCLEYHIGNCLGPCIGKIQEEEYDEWPEQLRTWMTWKEMRNAGYYAGTMESGIQKTLEDRFGKAEAQKIFREYAGYHLKTYTSDNIHQIAWDCLGYAMPTVLLQLLLDGRGYDSFSGRNVDIMMTGDPRLTELLLKYSSWWFLSGIAVVVVSGMICGIIAMLRQKKEKTVPDRSLFWKISGVCVITAAGMILWYTMRDAGCLDYKNGLLPGSLWLVGMILWTDRTISAGDTEDNPEK